VVEEDLDEGVKALFVNQFADMKESWDYYDQVLRNDKIFQVLGESEFNLFIISSGNINVLTENRGASKYWLFFQKHYNRNEGD